MNNRIKALIAGVVAIAAIITTVYVFAKPETTSKADTNLTITSSPLELNIKVANKDYGTVRNGESIKLETSESPELVASHEGFETFKTPLKIVEGQANTIDISLRPTSQEAKDLVLSEDDLLKEEKAAEDYLNTADDAYKKWPILNNMPHEGRNFAIYQGLAKNVGYDFGIYLMLYKGHEDEGRKAFNQWMADNDYNLADYDIVETIKPAKPSNELPEPPTSEELADLSVDQIKIPEKVTKTDGDVDKAAQLFATATTTWNAAKDSHPTEALIRAKPLMDKAMAKETEMPFRITTTPEWRTAAEQKAKSYSWITDYESETAQKTTKATVEVCWAWINEDDEPTIGGPRKYELEINKRNEISKYTFTDPDPFVDNTESACQPEN